MVVILFVRCWMGQTLIQSLPLVLHSINVTASERVEDVGAGDCNTGGRVELAHWCRANLKISSVLFLRGGCRLRVPRPIHHVYGRSSLDVTEQLIGLGGGVKVARLVMCEPSDVTIKDDREFGCFSAYWVLVDGLETVVWHLVALHSDVDIVIIVSLIARHTQLPSKGARVLGRVRF